MKKKDKLIRRIWVIYSMSFLFSKPWIGDEKIEYLAHFKPMLHSVLTENVTNSLFFMISGGREMEHLFEMVNKIYVCCNIC